MKVNCIVGADLSKKSIDLALHGSKQHLRIENGSAGFTKLNRWLSSLGVCLQDLVIVMEHTGMYSYKLEQFLVSQQIQFCKVSGLAIKRSLGIVRGKNDKIDAFRIARYGAEKVDQLQPSTPCSESMQRLKLLISSRQRLVANRTALLTAINEMVSELGLSADDEIVVGQRSLIAMYNEQINKLDKSIVQIIEQEEEMIGNYRLILSIKGIGKVVAAAMIAKTENFTKFTDGRKFACFCGTAPFGHSSGTTLNRKPRTSHLADKKMKSLFDLAAKSAIQYDPEMKEYYQRRVQAGYPKMSVINAVRTKLIYRVFAVVKRQTPYQPIATAA